MNFADIWNGYIWPLVVIVTQSVVLLEIGRAHV